MKRRGFLAGLLALPFIAPLARAAQAVKRRLFPTVYVGGGLGEEDCTATLAEAFKMVQTGGTIYLMPGHRETINEPITLDTPGLSIVGLRGDTEECPMIKFEGSGDMLTLNGPGKMRP